LLAEGKALLEAVAGSVLAWQRAGLIALFASYDHVSCPHRRYGVSR